MDEYEFPTETLEVFRWAQRFWKKAMSKGCQCSYKKVNVYTEFTGSKCAESAVEAVVSAMKPSEKPEVYFGSAADIKPACRKVAMSTRTLACAYCSIWVYECDMSCLMTFWFVSPCSHPRSELLLLWRHAGHLARQYGDIHQCSGKRGGKHLSIKMWHCITATCSIQVCHVAAGCSIMYHTFTISYVYIYIYICFFSIHVIQDSCWYPLQVRITSGDLLSLDQVNCKNRQQTFKKLFTNDGTLKINVGSSHKGWRLVCVKNTKVNTASEAHEDALQRLWSLIKSGGKKKKESTSFLLVGCSDRKKNKNLSSKFSWK